MKRIKLLRPHIINGIEHPPGTVLEVDEATAAWLLSLKAAEVADRKS